MTKTQASQVRGRKCDRVFSLRRVGWAEGGAEGGAGGVRAAVVAEGAGTCGSAAAAAAVGPLQHAGLEI